MCRGWPPNFCEFYFERTDANQSVTLVQAYKAKYLLKWQYSKHSVCFFGVKSIAKVNYRNAAFTRSASAKV